MGIDFRGREIALLAAVLGFLDFIAAALGPLASLDPQPPCLVNLT